jgi:hypothetical protein
MTGKDTGQRATSPVQESDSCRLLAESGADSVLEAGLRFRWSEAEWWAWEDLNLRLHPYQVSRAKRCADRRFPRSRPSVRRQGMRS